MILSRVFADIARFFHFLTSLAIPSNIHGTEVLIPVFYLNNLFNNSRHTSPVPFLITLSPLLILALTVSSFRLKAVTCILLNRLAGIFASNKTSNSAYVLPLGSDSLH